MPRCADHRAVGGATVSCGAPAYVRSSSYAPVPLTERKAEVDDQSIPDTQAAGVDAAVPAVPAPAPAEPAAAETPVAPEAAPEENKPKASGRWRLVLGAVVIIAGLVYLLYELGWFSGERDVSHWWGFLILIPAVASFGVSWWVWSKKEKHLGWNVIRWVVIGLALVALALVFVFKTDLNEVWPVLAIIVGVGVALSWKG